MKREQKLRHMHDCFSSMPAVKSESEKSESEHGIEQTKVKENKRSDILHGCSSSMPAVKSESVK